MASTTSDTNEDLSQETNCMSQVAEHGSEGSATTEAVGSMAPITVLRRPSYLNLISDTGLHPARASLFDMNVIKRLDLEFDETILEILEEEKLKTYLRIRPTSARAQNQKVGKKLHKVFDIKDDKTIVVYPIRKTVNSFAGMERMKQTEFKFSKVLGPNCGQSDVFDVCVSPIIDKFLRNENCLIFSYGATNSGKTYTMQGHGTEYGIIPRTLDSIFNRIDDRLFKQGDIKPHLYQSFLHLNPTQVESLRFKKESVLAHADAIKKELLFRKPKPNGSLSTSHSSSASGSIVELVGGSHFDELNYAQFTNSTMYSVWISFAELYNEKVYDLLDNVCIGKTKRRKELRLLQDRNGFVYIKDLTELHVSSAEEAYQIFLAGRKHLQFAATQMNQRSSRSHSFFTLRVVSIGIGEGVLPYPKSVHRLTFCDLAGMERAYQTENEGCRLKESGNINNSLVVLVKVIRILREKQLHGSSNMAETIPFRESKLTHIFKSYLTSSTHICMLVNINPDPAMVESTIQVLHNSAVASNIIVFRPVEERKLEQKPEITDSKELISSNQLKITRRVRRQVRATKGKAADKKAFDSSSSDHDAASSDSEVENEVQTVIGRKMMLERLAELERENKDLRTRLAKSELEKEHLREATVKLLADQNKLLGNRFNELLNREENMGNRRLSLLHHQLNLPTGTGSRCARHYSPVRLNGENIEEVKEDSLVVWTSHNLQENVGESL